MALERATPARLATSVASETSSASKRPPRPSTKVITPMTSPFAVSGTDERGGDRRCAAPPLARRGAGPAGCGRCGRRPPPARRRRTEGSSARARPRRGPRSPARARARRAARSPLSPGTWTDARVGQTALHQAHGPLDHRRRVEARAEEPGHLREERRGAPAPPRHRAAPRARVRTSGPVRVPVRSARPGSRGSAARARSARAVATKARDEDPERPELPTRGSLTMVTGLAELAQHAGPRARLRRSGRFPVIGDAVPSRSGRG